MKFLIQPIHLMALSSESEAARSLLCSSPSLIYLFSACDFFLRLNLFILAVPWSVYGSDVLNDLMVCSEM